MPQNLWSPSALPTFIHFLSLDLLCGILVMLESLLQYWTKRIQGPRNVSCSLSYVSEIIFNGKNLWTNLIECLKFFYYLNNFSNWLVWFGSYYWQQRTLLQNRFCSSCCDVKHGFFSVRVENSKKEITDF